MQQASVLLTGSGQSSQLFFQRMEVPEGEEMGEDQIHLATFHHAGDNFGRQIIELFTLDTEETGERGLLPVGAGPNSVVRFQQVEFIEFTAEGLRTSMLVLKVLKKLKNIVHIGCRLSIIGKKSLALSVLIEAGEVLVDAKSEGFAVF